MKKDLFYLILLAFSIGIGVYGVNHRMPMSKIVVNKVVDTIYVVTATVYHAVEGQCDDSPLVTASGAAISSAESAYEHRYLAVSRDLLDVFPYGTMVEVSGCGELDGIYCVVDTMAKRFKGYVDILINPDMKSGKWEGVRIRKVLKNKH